MRFPAEERSLDQLLLDDENPRLPEHLLGASQSEILSYMMEESVLDELAVSFLDHGYLEHEPVFVMEAPGGKWVVLEGNRRLATLMILTGHPVAQENELHFSSIDDVDQARLAGLQSVPVRVVSSREDVRHYVGFRHIGGLKEWPPEAKARWIDEEIRRRLGSGEKPANVFSDIGRSVGTNAQSVRGPYLALRLLRFASQELSDDNKDVAYVQAERFGVLVRATNSPDLRSYLAPEGPTNLRTLEDIESLISAIDRDRLARVLGDLVPLPNKRRAVLSDSRDVTIYARALGHPVASRILEEYADLQLAQEILNRQDLPSRIRRLEDSLRVVLDEVQRNMDGVPAGSHDAAKRLLSAAKSLELQLGAQTELEAEAEIGS